MLDWIADVVRLAYYLWPSYAGAFVLVSILQGLLCAPLTIRSARSTRTLADLQPEIQRIQAAHASDPEECNATMGSPYRSRGVAIGSGCLLTALRLAVLIALTLVVRGLRTLDPSNGDGPRYVEQRSALWQSLKDSGGQLSWFGADLGEAMFTQPTAIGVVVYSILLITLIVVTAESMRASITLTAHQGVAS